jgi:hypothetical protein
MRATASNTFLAVCLVCFVPAVCQAGFVVTAGKKKVVPDTSPFFNRLNATFTGTIVANAGDQFGNRNDLIGGTLRGPFPKADVMVAINSGDISGKFDGVSYGPIAKFVPGPPPVPFAANAANGSLIINSPVVPAPLLPDTSALANAGFASAVTPIMLPGIPPFIPPVTVGTSYTIMQFGSAEVWRMGARAPSGLAFASSEDPWEFSVDEE